MSGLSNSPKILKGAFVEYGISIPPLIVPFQFNPETMSRDRSNTFSVPDGGELSLRQFHQRYSDLKDIRDHQDVEVEPETISFDIRLDATDKLDEGDPIAQQFGITPQLSTLELMMYPKSESILGAKMIELLGKPPGYSFTGVAKPPMILFVWGKHKVVPVNITSISIAEQEFNKDLNPIRAIVTVNLTVIEGPNAPYQVSKAIKESMSALNLANIKQVTTVSISL